MLGYFLAVLVGLTLGIFGGGGSILTTPILVYVMNFDEKLSIALSLAIVGVTSLVGALGHFKKGNVNVKVILWFAPITILGTFLGTEIAKFLSGKMQLILFAIIMLLASVFMLKDKREEKEEKAEGAINVLLILIVGTIVGIITGIVGVGGGFLIVPSLVLLTKTPMKQAVGTSLVLISLNSMSGFVNNLREMQMPWSFLGVFIFFSIIGIILGTYIVKFIAAKKLKKGLAIFLILMGAVILYKNKNTLIPHEEKNVSYVK